MDFAACCMSQGFVATADATPFVRTVARTCTSAVRPCYRRLPRVPEGQRPPKHNEARYRGGHRIPLRAAKTIAARSLTGTGREEDSQEGRKVDGGERQAVKKVLGKLGTNGKAEESQRHFEPLRSTRARIDRP